MVSPNLHIFGQIDEGEMDILYTGAIVALWLMTAAFVRGCEKLGRRQ
jgi:hypothetical protein